MIFVILVNLMILLILVVLVNLMIFDESGDFWKSGYSVEFSILVNLVNLRLFLGFN